MRFTTHLLIALFMLVCFSSYAQDKIYMRNHDIIDAKVISLTEEQLTYKRWDNQTGPDYTFYTSDVIKVVYANGSQDIVNERQARRMKDDPTFGKEDQSIAKLRNYIYLAPIQFTENGFGASIAYERRLDKEGVFKFYLPFIATFNIWNNTYTDLNGTKVVR